MNRRNAGSTPYSRSRRSSPSPISPSPNGRGSSRGRGPSSSPAPSSTSPTNGGFPTHEYTSPPAPAPPLFSASFHPDVAALLLSLLRILGAYFFRVIMDCDETYNYWEPMHYMLYGSGMKTWENDVAYRFRSFGYEGVHAVLGILMGGFYGEDKITVFFRVRVALGLFCALCEAYLYTAVRARFGQRVALFTLLGLMFSPGMLQSAHTFLPTTFTMCFFMLAWGCWLKQSYASAVAAAAIAVSMGFPFAVFTLVPMVAHIAFALLPPPLFPAIAKALGLAAGGGEGGGRGRPTSSKPAPRKGSFKWTWDALLNVGLVGIFVTLGVTAYCACVDRVYYGVWTAFQWNTIEYNLFQRGGNGRGSLNYMEPENQHWSWFLLNLGQNFNAFLLLAVASPLALVAMALQQWYRGGGISSGSSSGSGSGSTATALPPLTATSPVVWATVALSQLYLSFATFSSKAHKEERFLYPVYPLIPLAGAITLNVGLEGLEWGVGVVAAYFSSSSSLTVSKGRKLGGGGAGPSTTTTTTLSLSTALRGLLWLGVVTLLALSATLCASRVALMGLGYSAPMHAWEFLGRHTTFRLAGQHEHPSHSLGTLPAHPMRDAMAATSWWLGLPSPPTPSPHSTPRVCAGQEWYRFPASFYLPERTRGPTHVVGGGGGGGGGGGNNASLTPGGPLTLAFFRPYGGLGMLPAPFNATDNHTPGPHFNSDNVENPALYVDPTSCDYIIDMDLGEGAVGVDTHQPWFTPKGRVETCEGGAGAGKGQPRWASLWSQGFLLRAQSSGVFGRNLYVPFGVSARKQTLGTYHVLQACHSSKSIGLGGEGGGGVKKTAQKKQQ